MSATRKVYKGRRKHTGQTVALKFISKHGKSGKDIRNLRQEIAILRTLNHENIILMFDAFETEREFCVVTEYAQVSRGGRKKRHACEFLERSPSDRVAPYHTFV